MIRMCECVVEYGQGLRHPYSRIRLPWFLQTKLYKLHLTEFIFYLLRMHVKQTKNSEQNNCGRHKDRGMRNSNAEQFQHKMKKYTKLHADSGRGFWIMRDESASYF